MSDKPTVNEREPGQFYADVGVRIRELEKQLAVERENNDLLKQNLNRTADKLAAEREKVQMLVDELNKIADGQAMLFPSGLRAIAANAVTRLKEAK